MARVAPGQYGTRRSQLMSAMNTNPHHEVSSDPACEPVKTARCRKLPLQTVTPGNPVSPNLLSSATNYAVDGSEFWSTVWYFRLRPIKFTFHNACRCDVTSSLVMKTCLPFPSAVDVFVNSRKLHTYSPSDDNWFTHHITIPADLLVPGTNHIVLETPATAQTRLGIPLGIWVQSASVGWNPGVTHSAKD
jgi:hypothetical protein